MPSHYICFLCDTTTESVAFIELSQRLVADAWPLSRRFQLCEPCYHKWRDANQQVLGNVAGFISRTDVWTKQKE